jgi:hypothetical protein
VQRGMLSSVMYLAEPRSSLPIFRRNELLASSRLNRNHRKYLSKLKMILFIGTTVGTSNLTQKYH